MSVDYDGNDAMFIIHCLKSLRSIISMSHLVIYDDFPETNTKLDRIIDTYDTANNEAERMKEEELDDGEEIE